MPEGPELHMSSRCINDMCRQRVFTDNIVKSEVHKSENILWKFGDFKISACSRGKELKLTLTTINQQHDTTQKSKQKVINDPKTLDVLFQFGMSGRFRFCNVEDMEKHSHLNFFTKVSDGEVPQVLSFVDYRRFGKWQVGTAWSTERGPCVMFEYPAFRQNVLQNLEKSAFNKPICEVLLNQKYFNGIGNYLRAEILYRGGVRPFDCARTVLEPLTSDKGGKVKSETPDILLLCNILPQEVISLGANGYDPHDKVSQKRFMQWLQCYYNPKMKNMADHNKRTIWFTGDLGPLVPRDQKMKHAKKSSKTSKRKSDHINDDDVDSSQEFESSPKKTKRTKLTRKTLQEATEHTLADVKPKSVKIHKATSSKSAGPPSATTLNCRVKGRKHPKSKETSVSKQTDKQSKNTRSKLLDTSDVKVDCNKDESWTSTRTTRITRSSRNSVRASRKAELD